MNTDKKAAFGRSFHRYFKRITVLIALTGLDFACNTFGQQSDVVANCLKTYRASTTTLAIFEKDAGLVLRERPSPQISQKSYLSPAPIPPLLSKMKVYAQTPDSPWKIYEESQSFENSNGKSAQAWTFVVGNTTKPICRLEFADDGILTNITPVENYVPPANQRFYLARATPYGAMVSAPSVPHDPEPKSPMTNNEVVTQILESYHIGKTTIVDLVKDAKLTNLSHPEMNGPLADTNTTPPDLERMVRSHYEVPIGSPWKVYESGYSASTSGLGVGDSTRRWKLVVGDAAQAICILSFDAEGMLREKTPVH